MQSIDFGPGWLWYVLVKYSESGNWWRHWRPTLNQTICMGGGGLLLDGGVGLVETKNGVFAALLMSFLVSIHTHFANTLTTDWIRKKGDRRWSSIDQISCPTHTLTISRTSSKASTRTLNRWFIRHLVLVNRCNFVHHWYFDCVWHSAKLAFRSESVVAFVLENYE